MRGFSVGVVWRTLLGIPEDGCEGLFEVIDDVTRVFEADGEMDETVGDAELGALFLGHVVVGGRGRVRDERLDASEAFGAGAKLERVDEAKRLVDGGVELEGEHATKGFLLVVRKLLLREGVETRVVDHRDARMILQPMRDLAGVFTVKSGRAGSVLTPCNVSQASKGEEILPRVCAPGAGARAAPYHAGRASRRSLRCGHPDIS